MFTAATRSPALKLFELTCLLFLPVSVLHGQSGFLTHPLHDSSTPVFHGWLYNKATNNPTSYHGAVDFKALAGTPVVAAADGVAIASCQPPLVVTDPNSLQFGLFVLIDHRNGYSTLYAHLNSISLPVTSQLPCDDNSRHAISSSSSDITYLGQTFSWTPVKRGDVIGTVGNTGTVYFHLHFEIAHDLAGSYATHAGATNQRVDAYAINDIAPFYPPPAQKCSNVRQPANYLWTACPPVAPPSATRIYVSVPAENRIAVVDPVSDQVIDSIPLPSTPQGIAVSKDGSFLLAVLPNINQLAKVHLPDKTVTQLNVAGPGTVAILPNGQKAYVTENNASFTSVSVIDPSTLTVSKTIVLAGAGSVINNIDISPSGQKAYVSFGGVGTTVAVVDAALDQFKTNINAQTYYHDEVAFSADSSLAVVSARGANCPTNGGFSQLDAVNDVFVSADNLTSGKIGVKVSADGSKAYLPDTCGTGNLLVFDLKTNTLVDSIPTGLTNEPSAVLLFEDTGKAFVVDETGTMSDVNLSSRSHFTFPLSTAPFGGILPWTLVSGPAPQ